MPLKYHKHGDFNIDDIIEKHFADCNIVLADGFTLSDKLRIIVTGSEEDMRYSNEGAKL
ncbi:MAG: hypothetical protein WA130_15730 [Candidatus Methanoperedens sp.]